MLLQSSSPRPVKSAKRAHPPTMSTASPAPHPVSLAQTRARPSWSKAWVKALNKLEDILPSGSPTSEGDPEDEMVRLRNELQAHIEQEGLDDDPAHILSGRRAFGVHKGLLTRAVVTFEAPPGPHPLTICFHYPTPFLNHSYVRHMVLARIQHVAGARVVTVQYQDRNVFHGAKGIKNRWIVKVSSKDAFDTLVTQGVIICHRLRPVSPYDDVLKAEFQEFREYLEHQKKMMMDHFRGLSASDDFIREVVREVTDQVLPDLGEES